MKNAILPGLGIPGLGIPSLGIPAIGLAALIAVLPHQSEPDAKPSNAHVAVERAMKDYVEGFYEAKPELIERGVSKDLVKYGYWRPDNTSNYRDAGSMNFDQAVALAKTWNAEGQQGEDLKYSIEVYEVLDKTASGKLTAKWGIDYFQLVKEDKHWKIRHVLWQSAPPQRAAEK